MGISPDKLIEGIRAYMQNQSPSDTDTKGVNSL
jgi:hypothetical protein